MEAQELAALRQTTRDLLPYPPLFVTVSGAHLYGFPPPDSDVDLRGAMVLPLTEIIGLNAPVETIEKMVDQDGRQVDLVCHDVRKFVGLMLNKNGAVLEQLYSPLVVLGAPHLEELRTLGQGCITRNIYYHYRGFAQSRIKALEAESRPRVKTLLYIYRVLMTGIHALETRQIEANLPRLNEEIGQPFIPNLIAMKRVEEAILADGNRERHRGAILGLQARLDQAYLESSLPDEPQNRPDLNDFVVRVRLETLHE